jgi:hypothetical protein
MIFEHLNTDVAGSETMSAFMFYSLWAEIQRYTYGTKKLM